MSRSWRSRSSRAKSRSARTSARIFRTFATVAPSSRTPTSCSSSIREEYYLEQERPGPNEPQALAGWMAKMARAAGKAEAIISKHRHGATGIVQLQFDASLTRFSDLAFSGQGGGAMTERIAANKGAS